MTGFPEFDVRAPLGGGREWTAAYDSYNSRTEDLYYVISLYEDRAVVDRFMVSVLPFGDPRESLARLAAGGVTNTTYRGYIR